MIIDLKRDIISECYLVREVMRTCGKYPDNCASAARNWHHHHSLKMFMCDITAIELNDPSLFGTIKIGTSVF